MESTIPAALGLLALAGAAHAQARDPSGTIVGVQGDAKDANNPDPALRGRNFAGVQMISNLNLSGDGVTGSLYNDKNGKTCTGRMGFQGKSMQLSGWVLGGLISRSQTWARLN